MKRFSHLLLLGLIQCLVVSAQLQSCFSNREHCKKETWNVKMLLKAYSNFTLPATVPMLDSLKSYCRKAISCLTCDFERKEYENFCKTFSSQVHPFENDCIAPTLREIYKGTHECTKMRPIFLNLSPENDVLYLPAKECVISIMKNHCSDDRFNLFVEHYDMFMDLYVNSRTTHAEAFRRFQKLQCDAMIAVFPSMLDEMNLKKNSSFTFLLLEINSCLRHIAKMSKKNEFAFFVDN